MTISVTLPLAAQPVRPVRRARPAQLASALGVATVVAAAAFLAVELRHSDLGGTLREVRLGQVAIAVGWIGLSLLAASYNLLGFTPLKLRLFPTVLAQLAVSGIRVVAPSAVSTPAIATRYLVRSGASTPDALATVGVAQSAQMLVTTVLVGLLGLASGAGTLGTAVTPTRILLGCVVAITAIGSVRVAAQFSGRVRRVLDQSRRSLSALAAHARRRPGMVGIGIIASAALTVSHILAFAFCVSAAGGHLPLLSLTTIYLAAATAGSLIPTPGGVGAVEAALIAGLTAGGLTLPVATAAALLSRIVSVWLLAAPGWFALVSLRRRAML